MKIPNAVEDNLKAGQRATLWPMLVIVSLGVALVAANMIGASSLVRRRF